MVKRFFYVCAGLFLLALSWHFGAQSARAQSGGIIAGVTTVSDGGVLVLRDDGEMFWRPEVTCCPPRFDPLQDVGNFWGGATAVTPATLGQLKARYR